MGSLARGVVLVGTGGLEVLCMYPESASAMTLVFEGDGWKEVELG
jgi:hypothetical protein